MSEHYNLYLVVSEALMGEVWVANWIKMSEEYRIDDLVVARNHGQGKWLAWDKDERGMASHHDICDMPKFAVRLKKHNVPGPSRVVSDEAAYQYPNIPHDYWDLGNAPHIGIQEELVEEGLLDEK